VAIALLPFAPSSSHAADLLYGPPVRYPVGAQPRSVAAVDVDGDGVLDLVSANLGDGSISVLRGEGGGAFGPATSIAVGPSPTTVSVGDLNHDNDPDLAVTTAPTAPAAPAVVVLLGTSGPSFAAPVAHQLAQNALGGTVADVNADGHLDVIAVDPFGMSVLIGAGDGSLGAAARQPVGTFLASVSTGDFNGDNDPDLALGQFAGQALVLLGGPGASFGTPTGFTAGLTPNYPAVGDVNGDGHLDLAVADLSSPNVSVLLGAGNGSFAAATTYNTGVVNGATHAVVARLDGDAYPDIVVTNTFTHNVSVLINAGNGTFGPATIHAVGTSPFALAVGDFNDDGGGDLAVADTGSADVAALLSILPNQPPDCRTVIASPNQLWSPNHQLRMVEVNGATDPDGDTLAMTITGVTQDEPVESFFGLEITPDAQLGSHPGEVRLRAERDWSGNGRVYRISFSVTDAHDASCAGIVTVGVPHHAQSTAVDSGGSYNSLAPGLRPAWWLRLFGRKT
jgi:hypothetical protein